ncbi:MAG: class I tRNA ligase family protein [Bryobacterales bacterium]
MQKTGAGLNSKGVAIQAPKVMSGSRRRAQSLRRQLYLRRPRRGRLPLALPRRHSPRGRKSVTPSGWSAPSKEFPLKLRNVYAFFTIYANIDGYDPAAQKGRPGFRPHRPRSLDPLRRLALTTQAVRENMDAFRAYEAAQALNNFVDGLSNWYVRRSRARYWKSEMDADKTDAYATLYKSLVVIAKLAAPSTPLLSPRRSTRTSSGAPSPDARKACTCATCPGGRGDRHRPHALGRNGRRPQHRLAWPARTHRAQAPGAPAVAQGWKSCSTTPPCNSA